MWLVGLVVVAQMGGQQGCFAGEEDCYEKNEDGRFEVKNFHHGEEV